MVIKGTKIDDNYITPKKTNLTVLINNTVLINIKLKIV